MKFCPNCGSVRDDKDKCACGYNYLTGETEEVEKTTNLFNGINVATEYPGYDIMQPFNIENYMDTISLEELKRRKLDLGELLGISYTSSGGMQGMYNSVSLDFKKKELTVVNQDWHHAPRTTKVYEADDETIDKIKTIILDNNMRAWSEIPVNRMFMAMDAPTSSMSLRFEQQPVSMSSLINTDHEETQIYINLKELVYSIIKTGKLISEGTTENENNTPLNGFMMFSPNTSMNQKQYRTFCPECGSGLLENQYECICGYKDPRGDKNE